MSTKKEDAQKATDNSELPEAALKKCGIIMPISDTVGYPPGHWNDVLSIVCEAFEDTDFTPDLVSKNDSAGLIHESIVTNIYSNEIVVCDVSSKNPNVMFELGLRLAFDKPVIIIKDEKTDYSFDTGPLEHLKYQSSLRFQNIVSFKNELRAKALATYDRSISKPGYSPYLKSFNRAIVPGKIENIEVKDFQYLVDMVKSMTGEIELLNKAVNRKAMNTSTSAQYAIGDEYTSHKASTLELKSDQRKALDVFVRDFARKYITENGDVGFDQIYSELNKTLPPYYANVPGQELFNILNRYLKY